MPLPSTPMERLQPEVVTAGSSLGIVRAKKRLTMFPKYSTSIASLSFSRDNSLLAVAASYTYEKGELEAQEKTKDAIWIRSVNQTDIMPKKRGKRKAQERL